jgi:23S rRNA pseudouridine1911/1915/1917 synthase
MNSNKLNILFEDNHLLVVVKPAGLLAQGDGTGHRTLVEMAKDHIRNKYQKPGNIYLGLVHRLDRPVSGVMVLARTSKAAGRLSEQFRDSKVRKQYLAVVHGCPDAGQGELVHFMGQRGDRERKTPIADSPFPGSREARLKWRVIEADFVRSVLVVEPITGRRHQIRAQLSEMGYPIVGDRKYGSEEALKKREIALHAWRLGFDHPVGGAPQLFTAPPATQDPWPRYLDLS